MAQKTQKKDDKMFRSILLLVILSPVLGQSSQSELPPDNIIGLSAETLLNQFQGEMDFQDAYIEYGVDFSSKEVIVVYYNLNDKTIEFMVDRIAMKPVSLIGFSASRGDKVYWNEKDSQDIQKLLYTFALNFDYLFKRYTSSDEKPLKILLGLTEHMSTFGINREILVDFDKVKEDGGHNQPQHLVISLCDEIGNWYPARWTANNQTHTMWFVVGGHGVCKGRCGAGCPWPWTDPAYSQDCLDHDACVGEEGTQFGECGDEWDRAVDDWLRAPDC